MNSSAAIALLWRAEQHTDDPWRTQLAELRTQLEHRVVRELPFRFNSGYFAPEFVTYLRMEQPAEWITQTSVADIFEALSNSDLASIEFEDAVYVGRTWPTVGARFLRSYIKACGGFEADLASRAYDRSWRGS